MYIENPQMNATMSHVAHIVRRVDDGDVLGAARLDTLQYGYGPFERLYRTADGWICVAALEREVKWRRSARCSALTSDRGGPTAGHRLADGGERIVTRIEERTTAVWLTAFEAAGVPAVEPVAATRTRS